MFVHKRHPVDKKTVEFKVENTGLGRVLGNKGGQVIALCVAGMSLCFVSTHLAATLSAVVDKGFGAAVTPSEDEVSVLCCSANMGVSKEAHEVMRW